MGLKSFSIAKKHQKIELGLEQRYSSRPGDPDVRFELNIVGWTALSIDEQKIWLQLFIKSETSPSQAVRLHRLSRSRNRASERIGSKT